jgi:hypothetical protein
MIKTTPKRTQFSKPLIHAINRHLSMRDLLEEHGVEVPFNGLVFCPFHLHHHRTKSAKVYSESAGNCLWCFAEQRTYRPFDVVLALGVTPHEVRTRLPADAISLDAQEPGTALRLPIVDSTSMKEFKDSGDLNAYLKVLDLYWEHRERLQCRDFQKRR